MTKITRKISKKPFHKNYYLVDASFLVNKYLNPLWTDNKIDRDRISVCKKWWKEIDRQVNKGDAMVYVPDLCIAEAFKTLSKKNYQDKFFKYPAYYKSARHALRKDIHLSPEDARRQIRNIKYHDIDTNRDIVISVDRFFEKLHKLRFKVGIVDLMLLASGKYLMDFFGFERNDLFIVTIDNELYKFSKTLSDIPFVFNPLENSDSVENVFRH